MPTVVAFGHGKILNSKLSLHILKRILHIATAQLAMLSIGFYLLSPFLHMHGSEHEGHGEQVCVEDFCTLEEHQESFEYCHEDTHLFCELCDWQQPVLTYFSIADVSVYFVQADLTVKLHVIAPESDPIHSKKSRAPPAIC
jgi:hypothetical protein